MSSGPVNPPEGFDELSREEQIEYVQSLWNRIAAAEDEIDVPQWHRTILEKRLSSQGDQDASSWEEVRSRLENRSHE